MARRPAPRTYDNSRRAAQADATALRVLDALIGRLAVPGAGLSVAEIAEAAGVSVPTVYKYFPNREAMFASAERRLSERLGRPPGPRSLAELRTFVGDLHRFFAAHETTIRAVFLQPAMRGLLDAIHQQRDEGVRRLLAPLVTHLSEEDATAVCATVQRIASTEGWLELKDRWAVPNESITRTAQWALDALLDRLERDSQNHRSAHRRGSGKQARRRAIGVKGKRVS